MQALPPAWTVWYFLSSSASTLQKILQKMLIVKNCVKFNIYEGILNSVYFLLNFNNPFLVTRAYGLFSFFGGKTQWFIALE